METVRFGFVFCLNVVLFGTLYAQEPDSASDLKSMVEAERSFARMAVTDGVRDAFVENFSDEAIIFRPGPVKGRPVWQQRKPIPMMIRWEPEYVDIAASGDFGYSTGPAEYFGVKPLSPAIGYGYFVSIWTKGSDGKWKVELDIGTEVPKLENSDIRIHFPQGADKKKTYVAVNKDTEKSSLIKFDENFCSYYRAVKTAEAFLKNVTADARFYLEGHFPTSDLDSIKAYLAHRKHISWKPMNGAVAASGDMGYTYGSYQIKDPLVTEEGFYFRVWKRENKQDWKIVIDMLSPVPPQK